MAELSILPLARSASLSATLQKELMEENVGPDLGGSGDGD
jgi:hypothetical protein